MSCHCRNFNILMTVEGITGEPDDLTTAIKLCFYDQKHFVEPDANRATFKDLVVHKLFDRFSPILAVSVANGQSFIRAVFYFLDGTTGDVFYQVTLREITFTSFEQLALDFNDSGLLIERIKINYNEIEWEWDGTVRCWDIEGNIEC